MTPAHLFCQETSPPTTPEELGARILIQERYEKFGESEEVEMEVESDEEDEKQEKAEEPPSQLDQDTQVQDMDEVCSWGVWGDSSWSQGQRGALLHQTECQPPREP